MNLIQQQEAARALQKIGVDVVGLVDYTEYLFEVEESISFPDFMEMVLALRGSNSATVKDIVDLRKFLADEIMGLEDKIKHTINAMSGKDLVGKTCEAEHAVNKQAHVMASRPS